jgi:hypothetical protein
LALDAGIRRPASLRYQKLTLAATRVGVFHEDAVKGVPSVQCRLRQLRTADRVCRSGYARQKSFVSSSGEPGELRSIPELELCQSRHHPPWGPRCLLCASMEIRSTSGVKSLSTFMTAIARPIVSISVAQRRLHTSPQWAIASSVAPPVEVGRGGYLDLGYALTKVRYGPFTTPVLCRVWFPMRTPAVRLFDGRTREGCCGYTWGSSVALWPFLLQSHGRRALDEP